MMTMKRILILFTALFAAGSVFAQSEYNLRRRTLFEVLPVLSSDIVFLGNSITDGCEWAELFNNRHIKNRGISGDRSGWLLERLDPIIEGHPKKLFLMIGINDLISGASPDEVLANIGRLIDRFQAESRWTKIYVQSILPVNGDLPGYERRKACAPLIVPTNKRLEALCDEKGVTYLDVWGALADENGNLDKRYTLDGLHLKVLQVNDTTMLVNAYNNASIVLRLWDKRKSLLMLGDTGEESGDRLLRSVPQEELDCDYIQMAHHGQMGVREEFYRTVRFRACLWPTPLWVWNNDVGEGFDTAYMKTIETRRWMDEIGITEHYISWQGIVKIE